MCPDQGQNFSNHVTRGHAVLLSVLALGAVLYACSKSPSSSVLGDAAHPTPVRLYTVAEETAQRRVQAVGSLFALEESILSSQVEGRVAEVLADVGDTVKQEQRLIVLDPQELQFEVDRQRGRFAVRHGHGANSAWWRAAKRSLKGRFFGRTQCIQPAVKGRSSQSC